MFYRKEAVNHNTKKWHGKAILIKSFPVKYILLFFSIFTAFIMYFLFFCSYYQSVNYLGEISTIPKAISIFSPAQGFVKKSFFVEGQYVEKNQIIYLIDISKSTTEGNVSDSQIENIRKQISNTDDIINEINLSKRMSIENLKKQKIQYQDTLILIEERVKETKKELEFYKKNKDDYSKYQKKGLITKDQLVNQRTLYYQLQNELVNLEGKSKQITFDINEIDNESKLKSSEFDNQVYQTKLQQTELKKELSTIMSNDSIAIRASSDGRIDSLSVSEGQMINIGDSLLQISPSKIRNYYLVSWVTNSTIPYINVGDSVNIRYDAFPADKFGTFSGKIITISKTPASIREISNYSIGDNIAQNNQSPYYKVVIKPEKKYFYYNKKRFSIENGMKANIFFFLEKRKIYQWIITPIRNLESSIKGPSDEN